MKQRISRSDKPAKPVSPPVKPKEQPAETQQQKQEQPKRKGNKTPKSEESQYAFSAGGIEKYYEYIYLIGGVLALLALILYSLSELVFKKKHHHHHNKHKKE
eukprot:TRINITY_DN1617_c0_g1_i4.p2 TRINITY_DN1617_c0_g1~~TRINITY_DN1617_c0_g1_i4.p2  ORF type:complete len:102 (+),score=32.19 TRINITY_DN1617_c0_g1_i4:589-894(+)